MSSPLLDQFVAEAADLLDHVDMGLLRLEQEPGDLDLINEIFRAAHTLKGSSGLFDLPQLTRLTHAAEDLLDAVRSAQVELNPEIIDLLLAGFDQVRTWMNQVEGTGRLPADASVTGQALALRLRAPLGPEDRAPIGPAGTGHGAGDAVHGGRGDGPGRGTSPPEAPEWLLTVSREVLGDLATWLDATGASLRAARYVPDRECFFRGEDPLHLVRQIPGVEHLAVGTDRPLFGINKHEEYDCVLRFTVLTRSEPCELLHVFRYIPDQVRIAHVDGDALRRLLERDTASDGSSPAGPGGAGAEPATDPGAAAAWDLLVAQHAMLGATVPGPGLDARIRSAASMTALAAGLVGLDPSPGEQHLREALATGDTAPLRAWIEDLQADPVLAPVAGTSPGQDAPAGSAGDGTSPPGSTPVAGGPGAASAPLRDPGSPSAAPGPGEREEGVHGHRLLKVEQVKVDRLLDLAGELVVAKNSLPFVATEAEDSGQRALARRIKDEYAVISRVSEELQQAVMDVRMLAVSVAFARIPRLVRDLTRKLGKSARLVQEGEDTAADKDVIESLAEPLVHLVRNSLDHGIEPPAEREAAGKPPEATLVLRAVPEGDAVVIEVADDGRGIDAATVRRTAYERGLIDRDTAECLGEEESLALLFTPGFSTAKEVSDLSGRGVGLDAVRADVERLGGTVSVAARAGQGTTVRLRLPLTMAVSRVLLLVAGAQRFGVRVEDVIETVSVPVDEVQCVAGRRVLVLRRDIVPLAHLGALLELPGDAGTPADLNVLIVRTPTGPLGLIVDRFQQDTDVILKPLDGLLAGTPGYCGTALLGDGHVLLVLDVKEVNDRAAGTR